MVSRKKLYSNYVGPSVGPSVETIVPSNFNERYASSVFIAECMELADGFKLFSPDYETNHAMIEVDKL